jgi:hypothetical protein
MKIILVENPDVDVILMECIFDKSVLCVGIVYPDDTDPLSPVYIPFAALREALEEFDAEPKA